jgi:hypothetical protein
MEQLSFDFIEEPLYVIKYPELNEDGYTTSPFLVEAKISNIQAEQIKRRLQGESK